MNEKKGLIFAVTAVVVVSVCLVVFWGLGFFSSESQDADVDEYLGASVHNYNTENLTGNSDYSFLYKGESEETLVFQIAKINDYVYAIYGYTAGDGTTHIMQISNSKGIERSISTSISKATSNTVSIEQSEMNSAQFSMSSSVSGTAGVEKVVVLQVTESHEVGVSWENAKTTAIINSETETTEFARTESESILSESSFSKAVQIPTEEGLYYCWAVTCTAYYYEFLDLVWDPEVNAYVLSEIKYAISFDNKDYDKVYGSTDKEFSFKYINSEICILNDAQIDAAICQYNSTHYPDDAHTTVPDITDRFGDAFDGGDGTSNYPYLISTRTQLELISEHPELCYKLASDIDLSKKSWIPIGDSGTGAYVRFTGELDGGGHTLRGMSVDSNAHVDAGQAHAGFFASIDNGIVSNIRFVDVTMSPIKPDSGVLRLGTIAGTIIGGTILDVYVQGTMTCSEGYKANVHAGGIVGGTDSFGTPHKVSMKNCISDVDIVVYGNDAYVGGIVGYANGSNTVMSYNFNRGDVSAHAYGGAFDYKSARAGGIVGFIKTTCSMDHVFNAGRIDTDMSRGYRDSGGIIGTNDAGNVRIDTAIFLKGMLYEANGKQGDVFCDGGRDKVKTTDVRCIDASELNATVFDDWDLEPRGLMFDGSAVCFIN